MFRRMKPDELQQVVASGVFRANAAECTGCVLDSHPHAADDEDTHVLCNHCLDNRHGDVLELDKMHVCLKCAVRFATRAPHCIGQRASEAARFLSETSQFRAVGCDWNSIRFRCEGDNTGVVQRAKSAYSKYDSDCYFSDEGLLTFSDGGSPVFPSTGRVDGASALPSGLRNVRRHR
jgi:hypothetical protein